MLAQYSASAELVLIEQKIEHGTPDHSLQNSPLALLENTGDTCGSTVVSLSVSLSFSQGLF